MLPEVGSMRRKMRRPRVLLPEPDSPTSPNVSPGSMLNETSSTARTSPFAPPPKTDSPSGKVLVRLRISSRGIGVMLSRTKRHGFHGSVFLVLWDELHIPCSGIRNTSLRSNERHRDQRRGDAYRFPAGEVFLQQDSGQQDGDRRVERSQHDG